MKADTITRDYVRNADIFADIFNCYIYNGEQVIRPDQLSEKDPSKTAVLYSKDGAAVPVQKFRDVQKLYAVKTDGHFEYVLYGVENQAETHYAMPVRNNLYDALDYYAQVQAAARERRKERGGNQKKISSGEFLSGFWKGDRLVPSITLAIHFGEDEWDGPLSLFEMMGAADPRVLSCMNDYRVHLISPALMPDEDIMKFRSSMREVMFFIKYSKNLKELESIIGTNGKRFKDLERRAADVITAVTNVKFNFEEGKERVDMCQAFQEMQAVYTAKGRAEGKAEGRAEGELLKAREIAKNFHAMGLRIEQIAKGVNCPIETVKEWLGVS